MEVKGIDPNTFAMIVRQVSMERYDGNVIMAPATSLNVAGNRFRARVVVKDSRAAGARRSASGRRMPAACWHVFRDVVRSTLATNPSVVFTTSMARYDAATFEVTYPATGRRNIGSAYQPVTMPELCDCGTGAV